jgi:hypothetical protein
MEHFDTKGSLSPDLPVVSGQDELCGYIERLVSVRLRQAGLHRDLSDVEREEAHLLERIRLYWLQRKIEDLEDESGVAPV